MLPSSTNMSASSSRLVDILFSRLLVIFRVNYGWRRGRGSAVEVDGSTTVLRPEIGGLLVKHPRLQTCSLEMTSSTTYHGRFSLEEASAIYSLRQFFAGKMGDYMILVFTNGDALWKILIDGYLASINDYLARNCFEPFAETPQLCAKRHVIFDNSTYDE
ncbi:hypothetical protein OROMI_024190 [Orobanche minor]